MIVGCNVHAVHLFENYACTQVCRHMHVQKSNMHRKIMYVHACACININQIPFGSERSKSFTYKIRLRLNVEQFTKAPTGNVTKSSTHNSRSSSRNHETHRYSPYKHTKQGIEPTDRKQEPIELEEKSSTYNFKHVVLVKELKLKNLISFLKLFNHKLK